MFGDGSRNRSIDTRWLTQDVVSMARKIYEQRDFAKMQELGQHLQRAGCDDAFQPERSREFPGSCHDSNNGSPRTNEKSRFTRS